MSEGNTHTPHGTQVESCENCRFWKAGRFPCRGICRFNPPTAYYEPGRSTGMGVSPGSNVMVWPDTASEDWCGKFEANADAKYDHLRKFDEQVDELQSNILRDMLLLADVDVPVEEIDDWTLGQMKQAEQWASAEYASASDHTITVPPKPDFLPPSDTEKRAQRNVHSED